MKHKLIKNLIVLMFIMLSITGCNNKDEVIDAKNQDSKEKIRVYASFYPIYDIASKIGGQNISVETIIPFGMEPHEYDPSMKSLVDLQNSNAIILNGLEFEPWIENMEKDLSDSGVKILSLGEHLEPLEANEDEHSHGDEHQHGNYDPHIWLDPIRGIEEAKLIKDLFIDLDPQNAKLYESNFLDFEKELMTIDRDFNEFLDANKDKKPYIIVSHDAFRYMAKRYDLNFIPLSGVSHEDNPSLKEIAKTIDFIKANNIKYVYKEELGNFKIGELLSKETSIEVLTLYTINGMSVEDKENNRDYIYKMKSNLENIKKSFE